MIKTSDLYNSINLVLVELYPGVTVYTPEKIIKDFTRPSFLIEHISNNQNDIDHSTVLRTSYFTITAYEEVDEYKRSDPFKLMDIQDTIINRFSIGYVKVGERAIKLKSSSGGSDRDATYIELQFEFTDGRYATEDTDSQELINEVITTIKGV